MTSKLGKAEKNDKPLHKAEALPQNKPLPSLNDPLNIDRDAHLASGVLREGFDIRLDL